VKVLKALGPAFGERAATRSGAVGTPALSFLTGPAGSAMRALDAMASGYQIGQGVGKVRGGDTLSGATDISTGILNATSNVAAQWGITKGSVGAKAGTVAAQATEVVANRVTMNSGGDRLIGTMGHARVSNQVEYNAIISDLKANGVDISYREGQFAYGPAPSGGRPGNIVFDPDSLLSAIKHEYGHFLDDQAFGFTGQRYYYENPSARLATERSQYLGEIRAARELGDTTARRALIEDYIGEKKYLIDNCYTKPYGSK
jgi:hypothetical protein